MSNYNKLAIYLNKIKHLKQEIIKLRPLSLELNQKIQQKFRLDWTYHSCAIEGNSLTLGETRFFILEGLTALGKPFKDHFDIKGHDEAILYLESLVKDQRQLNTTEIRSLHKILLQESYYTPARTRDGQNTRKKVSLGEYKTQPNHVLTATGEMHYYAEPIEVASKMQDLVDWYHTNQLNLNIVELCAKFHHQFTAIHPFNDGNGRMARLLMNLILMQQEYPPIIIKNEDRAIYLTCLHQADANEYLPLIEFIAKNLLASLELYLLGAQGQEIEDHSDFEKQLIILKSHQENSKHAFELFIKYIQQNILEPLERQNFFKIESIDSIDSNDDIIWELNGDKLSLILKCSNKWINLSHADSYFNGFYNNGKIVYSNNELITLENYQEIAKKLQDEIYKELLKIISGIRK